MLMVTEGEAIFGETENCHPIQLISSEDTVHSGQRLLTLSLLAGHFCYWL